jgi:hypothetical protein
MRRRDLPPVGRPLCGLLLSLVGAALFAAWVPAAAQSVVNAPAAKAPAEHGPRWGELTPAQRNWLKPLERDWASIDADRKEKWITIAGRMPGMPAAERERVQARMTEWTRLSPQQRGQARLGYQQANEVGGKDRKAEWEAYQALPAEQKRQLQARAVPPDAPSSAQSLGAASRQADTLRNDKPQAKSNIVPNPAYAAPPKPVAPTVVQAQPGATTSLMSKHASPPAHQQAGLPKIAATPEFVDKTTMLPRRGPQAAATRSAASAPAEEKPHRR